MTTQGHHEATRPYQLGLDRRRADVDAELVGARCLVMALRCHGTS